MTGEELAKKIDAASKQILNFEQDPDFPTYYSSLIYTCVSKANMKREISLEEVAEITLKRVLMGLDEDQRQEFRFAVKLIAEQIEEMFGVSVK
ncbi:MAG: hypothetical protein PHI53_01185 [Candidatus Pacebacteria bacterium]|nr:hypothetical protein [Candidatus Paceibacterota bacterium]